MYSKDELSSKSITELLEIAHNYAENGDYFPVITGCIDEIESFTTNAIIVWERI